MFGREGSRISDRRHNSESEVARQHLGNFEAERSPARRFLSRLAGGADLVKKDLIMTSPS
jgi:hypothetical protein